MTHKSSFHVIPSDQHKPIISNENAEVQLQNMQKYSCKICSCLRLCYVASVKGVQHGTGSPHGRDCRSARLQIKKK